MTYRPKLTSSARLIIFIFALIGSIALTFAQKPDLKVPVNVTKASLPITIGVPLSEASDIRDVAQLNLLDPNGNPVALQARALARWRGNVADQSKALKWVLIDFMPKTVGSYTLTASGSLSSSLNGIAINQASDKISVASSKIKIDFSRSGNALVSSYKIDGVEFLTAPFNVQGAFPHSAMVVNKPTSLDSLTVNETSLLTPGMQIHFEHSATLKWAVEKGWLALWSQDQQLQGNHRYLLDEGTPQQEEILVATADYGTLNLDSPLKFNHPAGAKLRDLTVEQETATIKAVAGQQLTFTEPLNQSHVAGDCLRATQISSTNAFATIENSVVEEANAFRVVIKQQGHFQIAATNTTAVEAAVAAPNAVAPQFRFTLRYYIYQDQPFVRVRLRLMNEGTYGFGAARLQTGPYSQHLLLRSISAVIPTANSTNNKLLVSESGVAYARVAARQNAAQMSAANLEIAVPEFSENFPKGLSADTQGLRFDVLPEIGSDYQFDGARAKTTDFYLGRNTANAIALTNSLRASIDPAYLAKTGAVRPLFVEKRDWNKQFPNDPEMAEAAMRAERHFAVGYAVENSDGNSHNPAQSIFEYRLRDEQGMNLGWRNFGDLTWAAGYTNVHYDLPYLLLREYLRTGDVRAFQLGSEMARYRADWGQYHADDYWDSEHAYNMRGVAFYEKGDHGSDILPLLTHNWIEGLWLHWALTGDEAVHEAAVEGSEALVRFLGFQFTADNAVKWNESRWLGWPALGLVSAWRYTGDARYLNASKKSVYDLMQAEIEAGKKGWFIPSTSGIGPITQPFMWAGYTQIGIIEYWRETGDKQVADFIVRVADWLLGKTGSQAVLQGGQKLADGRYVPMGEELEWAPDRTLQPPVTELAMLNLPLLVTAARITYRADFRATARQLFRDVAFYRDIDAGQAVDPSFRALINFRAFQFGGNCPKVYGHLGLSMSEYLPDLVGSLVQPRKPAEENSLLDDNSTRYVQVGQTLRVPVKTLGSDLSPLNIGVTNLPENSSFTAGEFVFTPVTSQAGKVFQIGFTGGNANTAMSAKLDVVVLADTQMPKVKLLTPSIDTRLVLGTSAKISWIDEVPAAIAKHEIRLSTDGGLSYPVSLAELPGNITQFDWQVPASLASSRRSPLRLMIVATDNQNRVTLDFSQQDLQLAGSLAVVSAADYSNSIATGSLCSAFGNNLTSPPATADVSSSLYQRNGTVAEILDSLGQYHQIPLLFADSVAGGAYDQVNFYVPEEVATGEALLTITASTGEVSQGTINVRQTAPAVFTIEQNGKGEAAVVATSDSLNFDVGFAKQDPSRDVFVSIFGTGWRFANQSQGGKSLASVNRAAANIQAPSTTVSVEVNGIPVEVLYAGAQPDYLGLDQINFRLPRDLNPGLYPMIIRTGEQSSNIVLLRVK